MGKKPSKIASVCCFQYIVGWVKNILSLDLDIKDFFIRANKGNSHPVAFCYKIPSFAGRFS